MAGDAVTLNIPGPDGARDVRISSPTRVLWPELGITKLELAQYLVAVGAASCESPLGFLVENRRAAQRAQQLVRWIQEARGHLPSRPGAPMRGVVPLNLGRYTKDCNDSHAAATARQRRIVLIAVSEMAEGLNLESCLQRAMRNDPSLEFLTENYSKFELDSKWKASDHL